MALALALRFRSVVGKFGTCSGAPAATSTSASIVKRAALARPPPASAIFNNLSHYNINQLQQLDDLFSRPCAYIPKTKKQKKQYHEISDWRTLSCLIVDRGRQHTKRRLKPALFAVKEFNKQKV